MELIRIGEGRLKVTLTEEDMARYALDTALADGGVEARRIVRDILGAAGAADFDTAKDKFCIQIFRGRGGGCELFVSRAAGGARRLAYAFDTVSRLAEVCRHLAARGYTGASDAYLGEDGGVFLTLDACADMPPHALDFLAEYGTACPDGALCLAEHATHITARAVETLAPLAVSAGTPAVSAGTPAL